MKEESKFSLARLAAALTGEKEWSWHSRFHPALKEHMHALGVVAANYNHLEFVMQLLFWNYSGLEPGVSANLFARLNNNHNRLDMLQQFAESKEKSTEVKALVLHFIQGFNICAENRNFLMHGMTYKALTSRELTLQKLARNDPTRTNYMHLRVQDIRKIADEIHEYDEFGFDLSLWITARSTEGIYLLDNGQPGQTIRPTLPQKPALPDKMNLSDRPVLSDDQSPPVPSGA